ncbi:MAG: uL22 family ribosomal protein [Candidatus Gottesmanbacteria bacterium]|nr:uL22 family ribosomal protein [Candidatus Gottesmanbacteria bacterium]
MEYQATTKYVRVSTRKVRLVADSVRKLTPSAAIAALSEMRKSACIPLSKTIASAIANAKLKGVGEDALRFKTIEIMGGPAMKRWQAVSRGQAHAFKKRMTHIRIIVEDIDNKKNEIVKKLEKKNSK